jgi:glutathione peroxidase
LTTTGGPDGDRALYTCPMSIYEPSLHALNGDPASVGDYRGQALLVVNVASKCGLTPQYEGLERLQKTYGDKGFTVLGFPCNQFGEQEPGSSEEIATFCSATYGVTFPMFEKVEVNGDGRHPVYQELVAFPDDDGETGDIQWNFEKFLVSPAGEIVHRFRPMVDPEAPEVIDAIEANLPG